MRVHFLMSVMYMHVQVLQLRAASRSADLNEKLYAAGETGCQALLTHSVKRVTVA